MAAAEEEAAAGALLAARAGAMSRENHQPTAPLHPRCSAHCDRTARAAAATHPHLGPIVWLGAPGGGGGKDAETAEATREREEEEKRGERGGGGSVLAAAGGGEEGEGSPALRGLSAK